MEVINKFLEDGFEVFMFCIALVLLFTGMKNINSLVLTTKNNLNSSNVLYEQYNYNDHESDVSYSELISILMTGLDCDIQVNGMEIKADTYDYLQFNYSLINNTDYSKDYVLDNQGEIIKIIYDSI